MSHLLHDLNAACPFGASHTSEEFTFIAFTEQIILRMTVTLLRENNAHGRWNASGCIPHVQAAACSRMNRRLTRLGSSLLDLL